MNCRSSFTVCAAEEDITNHTSEPEPKPAASYALMDETPGFTADMEPEPAAMSAPETTPEPIITPEPEPNGKSDQVHEPATSFVPVGVLVEKPHLHSRY